MAEVSGIGEANSVLEQFLPLFNQRFRVPPQYPEPAFRPLNPLLCLGTGLCLKHSRRVARDNTVRFQLLPGPGTPQLCWGGCGGPGRTGRPAVGAA